MVHHSNYSKINKSARQKLPFSAGQWWLDSRGRGRASPPASPHAPLAQRDAAISRLAFPTPSLSFLSRARQLSPQL